MKAKKAAIKLTPSSGNVFADLGIDNPEESLVKAELAFKINSLIKEKGLTQKKAAEILGVDQPKISALTRGRVEGFSIERLFKFLIILGLDVEIVLKPHDKKKRVKGLHSHLQVRSVA
jgi:predicted XRE-type DNA-binding protein